AFGCRLRGILLSTLPVLWTQQRCSRVCAKTSRRAAQKPSAPSPTASLGARASPRCFRSRSSSRQLPIGRLPPPRDVPPADGLVERQRLPDRAGVDAIAEEDDQRGSPVATDRPGMAPAPGTPHLMRREVERVD